MQSINTRGFTLIELLVTATIMAMLLGGAIAAFIRFSEQQTVITAAKDVRFFLQTAQQKAQVREVADACDGFIGYRVKADAAVGGTIRMYILCEFGIGQAEVERSTYKLPALVSVNPFEITYFSPVDGGGADYNVNTVRVSNFSNTVNKSFSISEGGIVGAIE